MTVEKLKLALQELEGFARRNEERAKKALEAAVEADDDWTDRRRTRGSEERRKAKIEAEARYHEAARVHQVIKLRVEEALHG